MEERFATLLSVGVAQGEAYERSGWRRDKSNASKRALAPRVVERVAELRMAEAERAARLRTEAGALEGVDELRKALIGAANAGQWSAAVSAAKHLSELDGSGAQLNPDKPMTVKEMLNLAEEIDASGLLWLAVGASLMLWDRETGTPAKPWTNGKDEPVGPYLDPNTLELVE
jgi:hypothetical protein